MKKSLGRLERVELRDVWLSESSDFTPWLAGADNLAILSDAVGLDLELEAQERNVGPFRADILCKDADSGHWVLIENQLARTDHTHLGQLLTYASGLQAVTIIWIAARFTEEHRATLDWLNEITDDRFRFFGLEVELWRIEDSLAAPKFNVISKPNDWSRDVGIAAKKIEAEALTDTRQKQLELPGKKSSRVALFRTGIEPLNESIWPEVADWMQLNLERFQTVFRHRIRAIGTIEVDPAPEFDAINPAA